MNGSSLDSRFSAASVSSNRRFPPAEPRRGMSTISPESFAASMVEPRQSYLCLTGGVKNISSEPAVRSFCLTSPRPRGGLGDRTRRRDDMEQSDPSFHLIVVSDLAPGTTAAPRVRAVDKDSLDGMLREIGPSIEVPGGGARAVLTFQDFKDFRPDRLAAKVPAIANLLEFRKRVQDLAGGEGSVDAVRSSLQQLGSYPDLARALERALVPPAATTSPAPAPKPPGPVPSGGVFDLVDAEASPPPEAVSPEQAEKMAAKLIDAVLGPSASKPAPAALRAVAAKADAATRP